MVDTNIIVSAFFGVAFPRALLDAARAKRFRMLTTPELVSELKDVISRPKFAKRLAEIGETVESLMETDYYALVEVVEASTIDPVIIDDPDDDALIACALGGVAEYIVSGDHHLLELEVYEGIKMVSIRQFLEVIL